MARFLAGDPTGDALLLRLDTGLPAATPLSGEAGRVGGDKTAALDAGQ